MNAQTVPRMLDKWITPVTLLAILSGFVFVVRLNASVDSLGEQFEKFEYELEKVLDVNVQQTVALARTAEILAEVQRRLLKAEEHVVEHERDAEAWKRRIMQNESALNRLSK